MAMKSESGFVLLQERVRVEGEQEETEKSNFLEIGNRISDPTWSGREKEALGPF